MTPNDSAIASSRLVRVCAKSDIPRGQGRSFKVGTLDLAVFHTEKGFLASSDICSHEHEHLSEGWLEGQVVECPRHGAQFDLKTGEALSLPADEPIPVFDVLLEGDDVKVRVPDSYFPSA
jgi:nitrite reductase/ring-hydroxylating ferredoxin subunit